MARPNPVAPCCFVRDARAGVAHGESEVDSLLEAIFHLHSQQNRATIGELNRIPHEIGEDLA